MKTLLIALCLSLLNTSAWSRTAALPSATILKENAEHNFIVSKKAISPAPITNIIRPFAEYEYTQALIFSSVNYFNGEQIKAQIVKNLPSDVVLYVTTRGHEAASIVKKYKSINPNILVKTVDVTQTVGDDFWARDGVPVPVYSQRSNYVEMGLVDAKYYHHYEPDTIFSNFFNAPLYSHDYYFEGGNFVADAKGRCMTVNNERVQLIPDSIFSDYYGCKEIVRFPFVDGIGHIDERVKILSDSVAVTDTPSYVSKLQSMGFRVDLLPRPRIAFGTYVNSLLINGTLFLPVFGEATDETALSIYQNNRLNVVPINASELLEGSGSIHCITMTYPIAM